MSYRREGVKPVYVSAGHRIDLPAAARLVLDCTVRYRLPEPTRLADVLVAAVKRSRPSRPLTPRPGRDAGTTIDSRAGTGVP